MADAAARREARRKRILENSHSRLQLISGKCADEIPREPLISTVIPEPEYETPVIVSSSSHSIFSSHNGVIVTEPDSSEFITSNHEFAAIGGTEVLNDMASLLTPPPEPVSTMSTTSMWEKCTSYKYDMVLLSLLIQTLYGLSFITFDSGYFFLPVVVYSVTKLIWFPSQNNSTIANVLLLLNGMSPDRVKKILFLTQFFNVVSRDTFVYLFTTICVQSLWVTVRDSLVT